MVSFRPLSGYGVMNPEPLKKWHHVEDQYTLCFFRFIHPFRDEKRLETTIHHLRALNELPLFFTGVSMGISMNFHIPFGEKGTFPVTCDFRFHRDFCYKELT